MNGILPLLLPLLTPQGVGETKTSGSVPLELEMGSPVVTLLLRTKDGRERPTRFLVDTGGGGLLVTEALALQVGLEIDRGASMVEGDLRLAPVECPEVEIDGMPLDLEGARSLAVLAQATVVFGCSAEGFLPGHVLARHHVVFDYPAGRFTLARPGALEPRGRAVPTPIAYASGFPRMELEIGGEKLGFLLDTGASFTMISLDTLASWRRAAPELETVTGAVGFANMIGGPMETQALLMRVPRMTWGPFVLEGVAAVSRPAGSFERGMSSLMTAPIVGAVGGNVLAHFRVEIDYAAGTTYLTTESSDFGTQVDTIGLVLGRASDGRHRVDAVATADERPLCEGVEVGDVLLEIDGRSADDLLHRSVVERLSKEPGSRHRLTFERDGSRVELEASVRRVLGSADDGD